MTACVKRTAFSLYWTKGQLKSGDNDYLTPHDMELLKAEIEERAQLHNALDTMSILDFAQKLKVERINKAICFLQLMRSDKIAETLKNEIVKNHHGVGQIT